MVDELKWSVEALREWAKDLFASRDEAARIAHQETIEQRDSLRREASREVRRIDEKIAREVNVRDKRLEELDREMQRRLSEERAFRDEVVKQALTREQYLREHTALGNRLDAELEGMDKRVAALELLLANIQGKAVVYAILGSIFLATATALITHLISG